ncbi:MAG: prolyl aminopeptidase [Proteobacteria bacterium]|nr:prolyl aminopeptidase [Pseudomonadota bacterium]
MTRSELFPEIEPFATGRLPLDGGHAMHFEQSGRRDGVPVLFLHGGPGSGTSPIQRRFFDPGHYRIVLFDQRGAGRSTPAGEVAANTTPHLVADIERLRRHLGISRWLVFGGSWGAALALAYGEAHPERCLGFVLRGLFLCSTAEVEWFLTGMRTIFPEAWRDFAGHVPEAERADLLAAYRRRLMDPDPAVHLPAARAWSRYEASCSTLRPSAEALAAFARDDAALALARIEAHYFANLGFLAEGALMAGLPRLAHLPAVIVQGRYDVVCPIVTADGVARAWPGAEYVVVADAGHSALEPGIRAALVAAMERMKGAR